MSSDRIVKQLELKASVSRVWRAITDHEEFGAWFRVRLQGPFVPGEVSRGNILYPGYEHLLFEARVERIEPERYFSLRWQPSQDPGLDLSTGPLTLVEFTLEPTATGTRLTIVESGFDQLPPGRRERAVTGNEGGWTEQLRNIEQHVLHAP